MRSGYLEHKTYQNRESYKHPTTTMTERLSFCCWNFCGSNLRCFGFLLKKKHPIFETDRSSVPLKTNPSTSLASAAAALVFFHFPMESAARFFCGRKFLLPLCSQKIMLHPGRNGCKISLIPRERLPDSN